MEFFGAVSCYLDMYNIYSSTSASLLVLLPGCFWLDLQIGWNISLHNPDLPPHRQILHPGESVAINVSP